MLLSGNHDLSIGNRILDSGHRELLDIIDRVIHSTETMDTASLLRTCVSLEDRLRAYFADEENIARTVDFRFAEHALSHQRLLEKLGHTRDALMAKGGMLSEAEARKCIVFFRNCLVQHIMEDSRELKIVLDTHYYDLKPTGQTGTVPP